mmetsp:Transcript_24719/g.51104  ORF Transcript_24719/g.51104 Transcript_24719/m.51104 type:complete len:96 (-) Transcript_24719:97-384(-)
MTGEVGGIGARLDDVAEVDGVDEGGIDFPGGESGLGGNGAEFCGGEGFEGSSEGSEGSSFGCDDENVGHYGMRWCWLFDLLVCGLGLLIGNVEFL